MQKYSDMDVYFYNQANNNITGNLYVKSNYPTGSRFFYYNDYQSNYNNDSLLNYTNFTSNRVFEIFCIPYLLL